jgi:hypothetical protein
MRCIGPAICQGATPTLQHISSSGTELCSHSGCNNVGGAQILKGPAAIGLVGQDQGGAVADGGAAKAFKGGKCWARADGGALGKYCH